MSDPINATVRPVDYHPRVDRSMTAVRKALREAKGAITFARSVRARQRRHRRPNRAEELMQALQRIDSAMKLVRPLNHSSVRNYVPREDELREASASLQAERRKLRKMLRVTDVPAIVSLEGGWSE